MTPTQHNQPKADGGWWMAWVAPHPRLLEPTERLGARLFAGIILLHLLLVLVVLIIAHPVSLAVAELPIWANHDVQIALATWFVIIGTYVLVRRGHYRVGAAAYVGIVSIMAVALPFATTDPGAVSAIAIGTLAIVLASIFLPLRWCVGLLLLIAGTTGTLFFVVDLPQHNLATGFGLLVISAITASLALVVRRHTEIVERARLRVIAEQEALLHGFVTNTEVGTYLTDEDGKLVEWNLALERLTGLRRDDVLGRALADVTATWTDQSSPNDGHSVAGSEDAPTPAQHGEGPVTRELRIPDRGVTLLESRLPIHTASGRRFGALLQDVSSRARAEEERRKLEQKLHQAAKMESIGVLAGGVAHDFNNLLTGIIGNTDLVLSSVSPEDPNRELLEDVLRAGESASSLTRQLLAFSRKQVIEPRTLDLNRVVDGLRKMLGRLLGEDVTLDLSLGAAPATFRADPSQIEQILVNLAVNARDAMPNGGRLQIETSTVHLERDSSRRPSTTQSGTYVRLRVSDSGVGMSEEVKRHLFEPFFTTKASGRGTGFGLAMVYGAVQQNQGEIEVYSEVGWGTTFCVHFPCVEQTPEPPVAMPRSPASFAGVTVLVVEDEAMVRRLCVAALEQLGCVALAAPDGESAIELARRHPGALDVLLTDVILPGINGHDLARKIQQERPEITVIFSSGYPENVIAHRGVLEPGLFFIGKPYTKAQLGAKLSEALGSKKPAPRDEESNPA